MVGPAVVQHLHLGDVIEACRDDRRTDRVEIRTAVAMDDLHLLVDIGGERGGVEVELRIAARSVLFGVVRRHAHAIAQGLAVVVVIGVVDEVHPDAAKGIVVVDLVALAELHLPELAHVEPDGLALADDHVPGVDLPDVISPVHGRADAPEGHRIGGVPYEVVVIGVVRPYAEAVDDLTGHLESVDRSPYLQIGRLSPRGGLGELGPWVRVRGLAAAVLHAVEVHLASGSERLQVGGRGVVPVSAGGCV